MTWTDVSDLELGSPDAEPRPSRGGCVAFVSSSPRSLARARTARVTHSAIWSGDAGAMSQAHPSGGARRVAASCWLPQSKFELGGPGLLISMGSFLHWPLSPSVL